jgi:ABC-2 type transport system permease protein
VALLIAERAVRDRRRGLVGWVVGIAAYVVLIASVYPAVRNSDFQRAVRSYPKELKAFFGGSAGFDVSTGAGYLNVELFSFVIPALLAIFAISLGAATLAGEQESGCLDLLLSNPLTRRRIVLEKIAALVTTVAALAVVVTATVVIVGALVDLGTGIGRVAIASAGAALAAIFIGLLSMMAGAATGNRAVAIGVGTAIFATAYLIVGLAGLASWIKPFRVVSPLYHATGTQPLKHGLPAANYLLLVGLCAITAVGIVAIFDRHDLTR